MVIVTSHLPTGATSASGTTRSVGKVSSSRVVTRSGCSLDRRTAKVSVPPPFTDPGTMVTRADAAGANASMQTIATNAVVNAVLNVVLNVAARTRGRGFRLRAMGTPQGTVRAGWVTQPGPR